MEPVTDIEKVPKNRMKLVGRILLAYIDEAKNIPEMLYLRTTPGCLYPVRQK
jgi:hypothetical protein